MTREQWPSIDAHPPTHTHTHTHTSSVLEEISWKLAPTGTDRRKKFRPAFISEMCIILYMIKYVKACQMWWFESILGLFLSENSSCQQDGEVYILQCWAMNLIWTCCENTLLLFRIVFSRGPCQKSTINQMTDKILLWSAKHHYIILIIFYFAIYQRNRIAKMLYIAYVLLGYLMKSWNGTTLQKDQWNNPRWWTKSK